MSRQKIALAVISVAVLSLTLFWIQGGFHSRVPGGNTARPAVDISGLKTVKAHTASTAGEVTVSGTVVSRDVARLAGRIMGHVVELNVDAGDRVEKGQVLLRIDIREIAERKSQVLAALESTRADFLKAKNDFERYKSLFEKDSVAKKDYDDAVARYDVAQASETRAKAALEEAETMLSYGAVTAPFSGIVSDRTVNTGDLASPGSPLLSIYKPGTLELVAAAGEQYSPYLKEGVSVAIEVPSLNIKQSSSIREVVPQRDEKTRTITVKAPLSEVTGLVPGLYGTMTFDTRSSESIILPRKAIKVVGQLETVRVVEQNTVRVRHIKTGRVLPEDKVEIVSGLSGGEDVVVE